jgi:low temperature requirement protein LtrA
MLLQVALNFIASMVYLGIAFRFRKGGNSRVFVTWYVAAGLEVVLTFLLVNLFSVLSFMRTHLMKRLNLLTVIFLGDAIIVMCQNIVTIVKNPDAWSKSPSRPLIS